MLSNVLLAMPIRDTHRVVRAPDVVRDIEECLISTGDLHLKHVVHLGKYGDDYELLGDGAVYDVVKAHPDKSVNVLVQVIELPNAQAAVAHSANVLIGGERRAFHPVERLEVALSVYKAFPKNEALKVLNGTHTLYTHKLMDANRAGEAMKVLKMVERRNIWNILYSMCDAAHAEMSVIIRSNPNATSPKVFSWQTLTETAFWAASDTVQKAVLKVLKRKMRLAVKVTAAELKELIMREAEAEAEAEAKARARAEAEVQAAARADAEAVAHTGVEAATGVVARSGTEEAAVATARARAAAEAAARTEEEAAIEAAIFTTHATDLQKAHDKKNAMFVSIAESSAFRDAMVAAPPGKPDENEMYLACTVCFGWLHKPFYCMVCGYKMCLGCTVSTGVNGTGAASAAKVVCPQQCSVPFATKASIYGTMAGKPPYSVLTDVCEGYVKLAMGKRKLEEV
jgi:hypothetical protein